MDIQLINKQYLTPLVLDGARQSSNRAHGFLTIEHPDSTVESRLVYQLSYDGEQSHYQVLSSTSSSMIWLPHDDRMEYTPFAIVLINTLMQRFSCWDGVLHRFPGSVASRTLTREVSRAGCTGAITVHDSCVLKDNDIWVSIATQPDNLSSVYRRGKEAQVSGWSYLTNIGTDTGSTQTAAGRA